MGIAIASTSMAALHFYFIMPADDVHTTSNSGAGIPDVSDRELEQITADLCGLKKNLVEAWEKVDRSLPDLPDENRRSAENFVHYLALRQYDIRRLQNDLARHGVSSLGRSESHVMSNITTALQLLSRIVGPVCEPVGPDSSLTFDQGRAILENRTNALLGPTPARRNVRIMVTLPTEAAADYELMRELIAGGMDCARINCSHDSPEVWAGMVENIRRARDETGRSCSICIDIAGPKLRTGAFAPGPRILKLRPKRDAFGNVTAPARVWLTRIEDPLPAPSRADKSLQFPADFIAALRIDSRIKFNDARGSRRSLVVRSVDDTGVWTEIYKTAYIVPSTGFRIQHTTTKRTRPKLESIPPLEQFAFVRKGDVVKLIGADTPGRPAVIDDCGRLIEPATIACTLPEVFDSARRGESVWFDDGKVGGVIESIRPREIEVRVEHAGPAGHRIGADKGINLPNTDFDLPPLTSKDLRDLRFIVEHADMIGYSFVKTGSDVRALQKELDRIGGQHLGIVLKIETRSAFEKLPEVLLAALERPAAGVMIARGDLAVESGFERLAEVQEEILWMCEAAHVPVIWATQVLEQLSKKGVYSRAEITDAAMSERAECVMLNKGPFVGEAVRTLDDILSRMEAHQNKKRAMMRQLKIANRFFSQIEKARRTAAVRKALTWLIFL